MATTYSVIGLGKLGASMAAAIASRGFQMVGVDVSQRAVEAVNQGRAPVQETDLEATIQAGRPRLRATTSHAEAVQASDVSFVVVPTPSDQRGAFSLQYAEWAFRELGKALKRKQGYHNVVLTSTVLPGSTRGVLLPLLEQESGKRAGRDFGLCYSPEFIALGSVIRDFLNPDFTLIGELDERCGAQLERCYAEIMANQPPCERMGLENAELTKLAVNTYVTTKMSFANMLAELCEHVPGGDVDVVTRALGRDARIGPKYLKGALGYGGPCFPRDNIALGFLARHLGVRAELAETTDHMNRAIVDRLARKLRAELKPGMTEAVLGLAYKPASHVIEESQGVALAKRLADTGVRVVAFDPMANELARAELKDHAVVLDRLEDCLAQADVVFVATPDPRFKALGPKDFGRRPVTVVDAWRLLAPALAGQEGVRYVGVGRSVDDAANAARLAAMWDRPGP